MVWTRAAEWSCAGSLLPLVLVIVGGLAPGPARGLSLSPGAIDFDLGDGRAGRITGSLVDISGLPPSPNDPFGVVPEGFVPTGLGSDVIRGPGVWAAVFQVENTGTADLGSMGIAGTRAGSGQAKIPSFVGWVEGGPEPDGLRDVFMLGGIVGLIPFPFPVLFTDPANPFPAGVLAAGRTSQEFFVMSQANDDYADGDRFEIILDSWGSLGSFVAVPEPSALVLLTAGLAAIVRPPRRRPRLLRGRPGG